MNNKKFFQVLTSKNRQNEMCKQIFYLHKTQIMVLVYSDLKSLSKSSHIEEYENRENIFENSILRYHFGCKSLRKSLQNYFYSQN